MTLPMKALLSRGGYGLRRLAVDVERDRRTTEHLLDRLGELVVRDVDVAHGGADVGVPRSRCSRSSFARGWRR